MKFSFWICLPSEKKAAILNSLGSNKSKQTENEFQLVRRQTLPPPQKKKKKLSGRIYRVLNYGHNRQPTYKISDSIEKYKKKSSAQSFRLIYLTPNSKGGKCYFSFKKKVKAPVDSNRMRDLINGSDCFHLWKKRRRRRKKTKKKHKKKNGGLPGWKIYSTHTMM